MYWSIGARTADPSAAAALTGFMLTDSTAAEILKIERGIPAFPEAQEAVRPLLSENELVSLDFAQAMQEEVVKPPVVTPASGVGFGDEYTRVAESVLFGQTSPSDAADEILEILTGMQPEG
jgi:multiple sugar transport system substrate-binding protein